MNCGPCPRHITEILPSHIDNAPFAVPAVPNDEECDGLVSLAKEQEREGVQILEVNVDFVGRNGEVDMHKLASRLVTSIKLPLMFDSTEWEKMEAGLQHAGGKSILNSTNYEDGEPRFANVIDLPQRYRANLLIGPIDDK